MGLANAENILIVCVSERRFVAKRGRGSGGQIRRRPHKSRRLDATAPIRNVPTLVVDEPILVARELRDDSRRKPPTARPIMRIRAGLFSIVSILLSAFLAAPVAAQSPSAIAKTGATVASAEGNAGERNAGMRKAVPKRAAKLPCARARWKDDPVCFGENDPSALPVPSARALGIGEPSAETRRGDILLRPKSRIFQGSNNFGYGSATNTNMIGKGMNGGLEAVFRF
jgi:hypothetical protein